MKKVKIEKYSHFFIIYNPDSWMEKILEPFCDNLTQKAFTIDRKSRNGFRFAPGKLFASRLINNLGSTTQVRFHINLFDSFLKALKNNYYDINNCDMIEIPMYEPKSVILKIKDGWCPRDYQKPIIDYLANESEYSSKLLGLRTGQGKTYISLEAISRISKLSVILIKSVYVEKWLFDINNILDINQDDFYLVSSTVDLKKLINIYDSGKELEKVKIIIITINVFNNFIKEYEENNGCLDNTGYNCIPQDFFKLIKAGVIIIDEAHQQFHMLYKISLHLHLPLTISLTATLVSNDYKIQKLYQLVYPTEQRYVDKNSENYIRSFSVQYLFNNPNRIRCSPYGTNVYNHGVFEKSIINNKVILENYIEMIDYIVELGYIKHYHNNDKLAIFASSIEMCTILYEYFKKRYNHLNVKRYVENDPYENIIESDIRVTTIGSGGTAVDIPDLRCVILTINIDSPAANIQTLGRLRKLPDRDVKFFYLWCKQLNKHIIYHNRRLELLKQYSKSIEKIAYPQFL